MGIGMEIIMNILTRLPVKSVLRFKCVTNSWKELISEPYFKKKTSQLYQESEYPKNAYWPNIF